MFQEVTQAQRDVIKAKGKLFQKGLIADDGCGINLTLEGIDLAHKKWFKLSAEDRIMFGLYVMHLYQTMVMGE